MERALICLAIIQHRALEGSASDIADLISTRADPAMREARQRLATEVVAEQAAKNHRQLPPADDWARRIDQARSAVAPAEVVAFQLIPREGGFQIVAITEKDLEVAVSYKTALGGPKV